MWLADALPAGAADVVDTAQLLPVSQLESWHRELDTMGIRATGAEAHERYIDQLRERLAEAGVSELHFEPVPIDRWTTASWSLKIPEGPDAGPVGTASYIPYSGSTPPGGVTGELVAVDPTTPPEPGSLRGKIAMFGVPRAPISYSIMELVAHDVFDPSRVIEPEALYDRPWTGVASLIAFLDALGASGATGAVGVIDLPPASAYGSYFPYDGKIRRVPGVFVDAPSGHRLKALAASGTVARLTLPAVVERVTSRNLVGVIPGRSDEIVILNSHTDGTNAIEDNGPNAIVAMCQYLTRLDRRHLPRTVMVVLTTGHFCGGVGQVSFVEAHRDTALRRTACAICLEHFGALEWRDDGEGRMELTGRPELGVVFVPENSAMVEASRRALRLADAAPAMVLRPFVADAESPNGYGWPGEGTQLWTKGHIPTANYITGPTYLLNWGIDTLPMCDMERVRRATVAFLQMALDLSRVPIDQLRALDLDGL